MSGTTTFIGHGTAFATSIDGTTYPAIAGVESVSFGSDKVDAIDTTNMSTSGIQKTYIGGLEDPGDCTVKLQAIPGDTTQANLFTNRDGTVHLFQATLPAVTGTHTVQFSGIITSIDEDIPLDKLATYTVKVKVSGAIVRS